MVMRPHIRMNAENHEPDFRPTDKQHQKRSEGQTPKNNHGDFHRHLPLYYMSSRVLTVLSTVLGYSIFQFIGFNRFITLFPPEFRQIDAMRRKPRGDLGARSVRDEEIPGEPIPPQR